MLVFCYIARLYRRRVEGGEREKTQRKKKKERRATLLLSKGCFVFFFLPFWPFAVVVVCADISVCLSTGGCITRRRATAASTVANTSRKACGCGCTCCLTQVLSRPNVSPPSGGPRRRRRRRPFTRTCSPPPPVSGAPNTFYFPCLGSAHFSSSSSSPPPFESFLSVCVCD